MNDIKKDVRVSVRFTQDERKLIEMFVNDRGNDLSKFVREATLYYINVSTEHDQLLEEIDEKNVQSADKAFRDVVESMTQILIKSIEHTHNDLDAQLEEVKKQLDAFIYTYLYHTPEIIENKKQEAKRSALERKEKVEVLIKG